MKTIRASILRWLGRSWRSVQPDPVKCERLAPSVLELAPEPMQCDLFDTPSSDPTRRGADSND